MGPVSFSNRRQEEVRKLLQEHTPNVDDAFDALCTAVGYESGKPSIIMSKTRNQAILHTLKDKLTVDDEHIQETHKQILAILRYDPDKSTYEKNKKSIFAYIARKKAEGVSTYVSCGLKSAYWKGKTNANAAPQNQD